MDIDPIEHLERERWRKFLETAGKSPAARILHHPLEGEAQLWQKSEMYLPHRLPAPPEGTWILPSTGRADVAFIRNEWWLLAYYQVIEQVKDMEDKR